MPAIEQENILHRLFVFFFSNILSVCLYYCFLHGVLTMPQPLKIYTQKCTSARITCTFSIQSIRKSDARFIFGFFFVIVFFLLFCSGFACIFVNQTWYGMKWNAFVDTKNWFWLFILWIAFEFGLNIYFVYLLRFTDEKSLYWVKTI